MIKKSAINIQTYKETLSILSQYDIITFDIFDTLITRCVIKPVDIFSIVEAKAKTNKFISKNKLFFIDRQEAEKISYTEFGDFTTLYTIYNILKRDFEYTEEQCNWLKKIEIEMEIATVIPRKDMLSLVKELKKQGKRIILCSDMYLSSKEIKKLLNKCGYDKELELWVSCEKGASKHNGNLWNILFDYLPKDKKTIHIGDNEWSDSKTLKQIGKDSLLIKKGYDLFYDSILYEYLSKFIRDEISTSLVIGYLINVACFNSPFENQYTKEDNSIEGIWMGYAFACFMDWLVQQKDSSLLLFVTREGYLLKPMYEKYCEKLGINSQKNILFYASRAATMAASISSRTDIEDILSISYEGTLKHFLTKRLNIKLDLDEQVLNKKIILPMDRKKIMNIIKPYLLNIIENGKKQKEAYLKYIDEVRKDKNTPMTVVDIGYNGTIQYGLSKITGEILNGRYMFVNNKGIRNEIKDRVSSLRITTDGNGHPIVENLLFLEAALQVPFGQLQKMDIQKGKSIPIFNSDKNLSQYNQKAQQSYINFIEWIAQWKAELSGFLSFNFELAESIWILLLKYNYLPKKLLESFWLSDDFSGHPMWKYNYENQIWEGKNISQPIYFGLTKSNNIIDLKYKIKNLIKKYIPIQAYEPARRIWIKYIK